MSRIARVVALLVVAVFVAMPLLAAEGKKAAKAKALPLQFQLPKEITLTAEQQKKLDELVAQYTPKLDALQQQRNGILSEEQRKAGSEARKAAQAAKKTRTESQKAMDDAMKVTPEQKSKLEPITKESGTLGKEIRGKVLELLTPEQKESLKKAEQKKKETAKK